MAEVAVVGKPHNLKGEGIFAYIVLKGGEVSNEAKEINEIIKKEIGSIALCDDMVFIPGLPKTRSGKIMRRVLRSIAKGEAITQDISTLEDPSVVAQIEAMVAK